MQKVNEALYRDFSLILVPLVRAFNPPSFASLTHGSC